MPLVVKDRVRETTTTLGTGTITLAGAVAGFQSFSAIGNANTTYYTINLPGANEWEVGIGTYTASGTTLSRDTILASSNGGSAVNFSAGTKDVFCTYPAGKSAYLDASNNLLIGTTTNTNTSNIVANGTISETVSSTQYLVASQFDVGTNPNQIPLNQYLGDMAFQSSAGVSVGALTASGAVTLSGGTANGVVYLNASKVATTGSALTFDGSRFLVGTTSAYLSTFKSVVEGATSGSANFALGLLKAGTPQILNGDVLGNIYFYGVDNDVTAGNNNLGAQISCVATTDWTTDGTTSNAALVFYTHGTASGAPPERMRLDSSGNLGIGTTAPNAKLTVGDPTGAVLGIPTTASFYGTSSISSSIGTIGLFSTETAGADVGPALTFGGKSGNTYSPYPFAFIQGAKESATAGNYAGYLRFLTVPADGGSPVVGMHLSSVGNLGIGTNAPTQKLTLVNNAASTFLNTTDNTVNTLYGTSTGLSAGLLGTLTNHPLVFYANNGEKMRLDASGNLGLGVTPSTWRTSEYKAIQVGNGGSVYGRVAAGDEDKAGLASNAYFDNTGNRWEYIATDSAANYTQIGGGHYFYTAPSGTAGDEIPFTQTMMLDSSALRIGETANKTSEVVRIGGGTQSSILLDNAGRSNGAFVGAFNDAAIFGVSRNPSTGVFYNTSYYASEVVAVGTTSTSYISFGTAAAANTTPTERARITSGGYFKASNAGTYQDSAASYHELRSNGATADWTAFVSNTNATDANVYGIRVLYTAADPNGASNQFLSCADFNGSSVTVRAEIRSNGGLANYQSNNVDLSDARTKTDINPLGSYWSKIAGLEIVSYKYKDQTHDDLNIGVIAQQVEAVAPEFVDSDGFGDTPEDGVPLKTIYNKDLTFAAIKALQEAMARIETLEAKIAVLESKGV